MAAPLDLANIQGDILIGLSKKTELFFFFQIANVDAFRSDLANLIPLITTGADAQADRSRIRSFKVQARMSAEAGDGNAPNPGLLEVLGVNVAFSAVGIQKIGITDNINDELFANGMQADAFDLGDKGTGPEDAFNPDWDAAFLGKKIDGAVLVTGDSRDSVNAKLGEVKSILQSSVQEITTLVGDVRPGAEAGHEHFGYLDGISQPWVTGVGHRLPGQIEIDEGVILLGRGRDAATGRPAWALDGSFLAFRKLPQLVPEFDKFLIEVPKQDVPADPRVNPVDLLGARFVGRWKSGAPVQLTPEFDDPALATDVQRRNDFVFDKNQQTRCPFAAHIRKMVPRNDLDDFDLDAVPRHSIIRRGIPFGPEVTPEERQTNTTLNERGLFFLSYQSNLSNGFNFLQQDWANNTSFPPRTSNPELPGFDPIIGQTAGAGVRSMTGAFGANTGTDTPLPAQWVNSKGGEYLFSPSLLALRETFAKA